MPRRLIALLFLLPILGIAAVWPDPLGPYHLGPTQPVAFNSDSDIWDEYGFKEAEQAQYSGDGAKFAVTAWRFQDPTGAMAAFELLRPADSKPSSLARFAAETPDTTFIVHGNYVIRFAGLKPTNVILTQLVESLKLLDTSPFPSFIDYLPTQDRVLNSERYIEGPAALAKFAPGVPPSAAAFHLSAEAQLAFFAGGLKMALFDYPTPQIAMQQILEFQKIPGAIAKRSGPLVAVILPPANADAAEKLLSLVRYQADITLNERVSTRRDNIGNLVINAFILIGILLCFSLVGGLAVGGVRAFLHSGHRGGEAEGMILLHLQDR